MHWSKLHYVSFPSLHTVPLQIAARFREPANEQDRNPAVVILHGSAGPSAREEGYANALNAAGFATLELDQWSPRGLGGGSEGRPRGVPETLPDVYGAKRFLSGHPRIDAARIGVMGFSFGGVATMLSSTHGHNDRFDPDAPFAAMLALYPVCWIYNKVPGYEFANLVDRPLKIVTGALDQYDNNPDALGQLVQSLAPADRAKITAHVMPDAHHGFDMPGVDVAVTDPMGNLGKGGSVIMRHNPDATALARRLAVEHFTRAFA